MSLSSPGSAPPGWYPDPNHVRQWRVWTGSQWSEVTRSYGQPAAPSVLGASLALLSALHRLVRYGITATFAGLGLIVSILAHWPGTAHPTNAALAATLLDAGFALLLIGSVCYAFAARELLGRWSIEALLPGVNIVVVSATIASRLSGRSALRRVVSESVLLVLFIVQGHAQLWLGVAPVIIALDHARWTGALVDTLGAPGPARSAGP